MEILFSMTMGVSLLLSLLMAIKVKEHLSNIFMLLILLLFCLGSSYLVFKDTPIFLNKYILTLINTIPVALGSLTYLYIYYSIYNEKMFKSRHLFLFAPFAISLIFSYIEITQHVFWVNIVLNIGTKIIWNLVILVYTLFFIKQSAKQIPSALLSNINWLNQFVKIEIGVFVFYLTIISLWILNIQSIKNIEIYSNLGVALFVFPISFIGIQNNDIFKKNKPNNTIKAVDEINDNAIEELVSPKTLLSDEKVAIYFLNLCQLMQEEKPYLAENITIETVASALGIHTKYLSYVINNKTNKPFNDFINEYRVKHFNTLIEKNEHKNKTILALAYESGFASKSSFNRIYKNLTGLSPSEYIKNRA